MADNLPDATKMVVVLRSPPSLAVMLAAREVERPPAVNARVRRVYRGDHAAPWYEAQCPHLSTAPHEMPRLRVKAGSRPHEGA